MAYFACCKTGTFLSVVCDVVSIHIHALYTMSSMDMKYNIKLFSNHVENRKIFWPFWNAHWIHCICHSEFHSVCHLITLLTWIFTSAFHSQVLPLSFQLNTNTTFHLYKTEKDVSWMFSIILCLTYMIMRTLNSLSEFIFNWCLQAGIV